MEKIEEFKEISDVSSEEVEPTYDLTNQLNIQQKQTNVVLEEGEAFRTKNNKFEEFDWEAVIEALQDIIRGLSDLTKTNIRNFYPQQYNETIDLLYRAFFKRQNNSVMLLSRSKHNLRAVTLQAEREIRAMAGDDYNIKVVKVNSTLNNSENKIQNKFCEALGLKDCKTLTSIEMLKKIEDYFVQQKDLSICFIFEEIDSYVQTTKQRMLYKILDLMTQLQIPFAFIATSQQINVAEKFEKRIKSRFSHRSILFYKMSPDLYI